MTKHNSRLIKFMIFAASVNMFLAIIKLFGGIFGDSNALVSDAIHSLADVLSSLIVLIGIFFSQKNIDDSHTYGHERLECVASLLLAGVLFFSGITLGKDAIKAIISPNDNICAPNMVALVVALISIIVKEMMFWLTLGFYKKTGLISLKADAWHQRIDALSSIGSLFGIIGTMLGFSICDSIASLFISVFILKISIEIFIEACNRMVDKSCSAELENQIKSCILMHERVGLIIDFKSRLFGAKVIVEAEVGIEKNLSLIEATILVKDIESTVKEKFDIVKNCRIISVPLT